MESPPRARHAIVEFFAGVGSVADGFERGGPFEAVYLNDVDPSARDTYLANHCGETVYSLQDVRQVTVADVKRSVGERQVVGVLGCPPCQGWSAAGKRDPRDVRNALLTDFFRLVKGLKPLFVVMENVPAVARRAELTGAFGEAGRAYQWWSGVLNAASYGLPQSRQRTIVIGYRRDTGVAPTAPPPTHAGRRSVWDYASERLVTPSVENIGSILGTAPALSKMAVASMVDLYPSDLASLANLVTLREAIADLSESTPPSLYALSLGAKLRATPSGHDPWLHGAGLVERLRMVPEGCRAPLAATNNRTYYSQAYARLHRRGLARTITTNFHNPGSGRFTHYAQDRTLTIREAARIQGFRDDFEFDCPATHAERLVGNAFPQVLATAIARHVAVQLAGVL